MNYQPHQFEGQLFRDLSWREESWAGASVIDCTFEKCQLANIDLTNTQFQAVTFRQSKIIGLDFSRSSKLLLRLSFEKCLISYSIFSTLNLADTSFTDCQVTDCDFISTNLTKANFNNADLAGTRFENCNLSQATFRGAYHYHLDPTKNIFKKTRFSLPEVVGLLAGYDLEID